MKNIYTMLLGLLIYIVSNFEVSQWTSEISTSHIVINNIFRGTSISIFYVPLASITYTSLPNNLRTDGASLFQFLRTLGTGSAVAIFITLLNYYYKINYQNIRNFLNDKNFEMRDFFDSKNISGNEQIYFIKLAEHYSNINSILSDFFILALIPIIFFPFFLLFKKK